MQLLSLCSGVGALDMAVEKHFDATLVAWSEIDKAASKVMRERWPSATELNDLTQLDEPDIEADIITAGFPCQPFSMAGLRKGNDDKRAIFEHIGHIIGRVRPRIVVLENVQGILTASGGQQVLGSLTSMGYDSRWGLVRASDAGAPHRRARWFCVAADTSGERHGRRQDSRLVGQVDSREEDPARERERTREESLNRTEKIFGQYAPAIDRWERILGRAAPPVLTNDRLSPSFVEWMMGLDEDHVCGLVDKRKPALRLLGNTVVPQQAALALQILA